jgi:ribosomal protein S18 acetylase RimI-like enzyme
MSATLTFAPLSWLEGGALEPFLDAEAPSFPTPDDFGVWREWTLARLMMGELRCWAVKADGRLLGGLLGEWQGAHFTIQRVLGELDDVALAGLVGAIKDPAEAILIEETAGQSWVARLGACGLASYARQGFTVDLTLVNHPAEPAPPGVTLRPWAPADQAALVPVLSEANTGTLNGLFLTRPYPTDEPGCARALEGILAGKHGEFLPWASFVAESEGRLLGAVLVVQEGELPNVYELAVRPDAQGRHLPRRLTVAVRHAMLARGQTHLHLATTNENPAVHRMFKDDEVAHFEQTWGAYWLKQPRRKPRPMGPRCRP